MKIVRKGHKFPSLAIVACVHGNEKIGSELIDVLNDTLESDHLLNYVVANEDAMALDKRFIDSDLNRSFPWR